MSDDFRDKGGSPWGSSPGGGGNGSGKGPTPPDIDAIIRDIQNISRWRRKWFRKRANTTRHRCDHKRYSK